MKSLEKNIQNLDLAFDNLFDSKEVDYDIEAKILASKVLSEISIITNKKKLKRKNVAKLIGTSASYLTQLYRGSKLLNFITIAKLKDKLDLEIEIKFKEKEYKDSEVGFNYESLNIDNNIDSNNLHWLVYTNLKHKDNWTNEVKKTTKVIKKQLTA
jgi:transcriptional regulator with XRE-family HTH domain